MDIDNKVAQATAARAWANKVVRRLHERRDGARSVAAALAFLDGPKHQEVR